MRLRIGRCAPDDCVLRVDWGTRDVYRPSGEWVTQYYPCYLKLLPAPAQRHWGVEHWRGQWRLGLGPLLVLSLPLRATA